MKATDQPKMIFPHLPSPKVCAAFGRISIRHAHLDLMLTMMIKSLTRVAPAEAIDATAFEGSSRLRDRIKAIARTELGEGAALLRLQALLERSRRATEKRNEYVHGVVGKEWGGKPKIRNANNEWKKMPTLPELRKLEADIQAIAGELNEARLSGFIAETLAAKRPKKATTK